MVPIDITLDFKTECPEKGKDPDVYSPSLRQYHKVLWSKPLPDGTIFELDASGSPVSRYLMHESARGTIRLSSDAITTRMLNRPRVRKLVEELPEGAVRPHRGYIIGSALVFPANRVQGRMTINGARGFLSTIADRFDLTLECIRRHYAGETSPLARTLEEHSLFFNLFEDFENYVEFFLLQDLLTSSGTIDYWLPFQDFRRSAVPKTSSDYVRFRSATENFIDRRNQRVEAWTREHLS